jgi:hypothetical protein
MKEEEFTGDVILGDWNKASKKDVGYTSFDFDGI